MKKIPLTQGKFALVDDADYEWVNEFKWWLSKDGYAIRTVNFRRKDGTRGSSKISMHREILKAENGEILDHIDNNRLNNQKQNLRKCTASQNSINSLLSCTNKSGFRGVHWYNKKGKFRARITINLRKIDLGLFTCPIEAARAYNAAAIKYHGEFANLNTIPQ